FQGNCFELDQSYPYAPLFDLLRNIVVGLPQAFVAEQLGPALSDLLPMMPELGPLVPAQTQPTLFDAEVMKHRINQAFIRIILRLAASRPLFILIEDIHWGDEATLE